MATLPLRHLYSLLFNATNQSKTGSLSIFTFIRTQIQIYLLPQLIQKHASLHIPSTYSQGKTGVISAHITWEFKGSHRLWSITSISNSQMHLFVCMCTLMYVCVCLLVPDHDISRGDLHQQVRSHLIQGWYVFSTIPASDIMKPGGK